MSFPEMAVYELKVLLGINLFLWLLLFLLPPIVAPAKYILNRKLPALGMSLYCFVFVFKGSVTERLLRHELAHYRQQRRYSPFGLAVLIFFHYSYLYIKYNNFAEVYRHSVVEREAMAAMDKTEPLPSVLVWDKQHKVLRYYKKGNEQLVQDLIKIASA